MRLIYKIEFFSSNFYYKKIIDFLINEKNINGKASLYKDFILLVLDEDENIIEDFFLYLEKELPISIFIGKSYVIKEIDDKWIELEDKKLIQNLSLLTNNEILKIISEYKIDFTNNINLLKENKVSRFETHNGLKDLFLASKELRVEFESKNYEVKLLITNINKITDILEVSPKDLQLLCSIERPLVKLKFKLLSNKNKEFSNTNYIYAKIADDKETVLFSQALKNEGINYLLYVNDEVYQDGLKITYNNKQNIIIHGDKGLFPKYDYILKKQFNSSKEYFDQNGGVFKATLSQFNKRLVPSIGIYFSYDSDKSAIKVNKPGLGEKDIILIPNIKNDINICLEEIALIDENRSRLVENYRNKFKDFFNKEFLFTNSNGFAGILNICAYLLGMRDYREFEASALNFSGKSGVQIDMKVIKIDSYNYLDYRKVIQSMMSYKIADVPDSLIAYSFYESLSDFIKENCEKIKKDFFAKDLVLCGNIFSNSILLSKVQKELIKSYEILMPKNYPLDY